MHTHQIDYLYDVNLNENLTIIYKPYHEIFTNTEDLKLYISNYHSIVHVICITEIRVRPDELYLCQLDDYIDVCCPRTTRGGGGACMLIHRSMVFETLINEEFLEGSLIVVALRSAKQKIGVVYRPPHADLAASINFLDSVLENHKGMLCVGDFNINLLSPISRQYQSMVTLNGYSFLNRIDASSFTHGNSLSGSIIAHGITDLTNYEYCVGLHDISFTDHRALLISLKGANNLTTDCLPIEHTKCNLEQASTDLSRTITLVTNLNEFCTLISDVIRTNTHQVRIQQKKKPRKPPWIDEYVLTQMRIREQLFRRTLEWPNNIQIKLNYCRQKTM